MFNNDTFVWGIFALLAMLGALLNVIVRLALQFVQDPADRKAITRQRYAAAAVFLGWMLITLFH